MKISAALLALTALSPSAAFMIQQPITHSKKSDTFTSFSYLSSLGSTNDGGGSSSSYYTSNQSPQTSTQSGNKAGTSSAAAAYEAATKKLEARLAALEREGPGTSSMSSRSRSSGRKQSFDKLAPVQVQGGSLKTWSFASTALEFVQVKLQTEGRPLDADIELWQGPDNTPHRIRAYVEDGSMRPFNAVILTPRGPNTIAIRNTGQLEFPLSAFVIADSPDSPNPANLEQADSRKTIQGGALRTYPFDPSVESVQVLLKSDGRPLNARIELLQGPNNNKQVVEVYTEDGMDRPFFLVIETPGSGNVVRVVNSATVEFPMTAVVEPYRIDSDKSSSDVVIGGDSNTVMQRNW